MKISVLLAVAVSLSAVSCRRLTSNDINSRSYGERPLIKSWVKITQAPDPDVRAVVGEALEIECEASGSPPPMIQWFKEESRLTDYEVLSNEIADYPPRGLGKVKARLVINSVMKKDQGVYICRASSNGETARAATTLQVARSTNFSQFLTKIQPTPARIVYYNTIYMDDIGSNVELPCRAVGNPLPKFVWLDPTDKVIENGSDPRITVLPYGGLRIAGIIWNDMGPYTCVAKNSESQDTVTTFLYPMLAEK